MKTILVFAMALFASGLTFAQGTFVYDQQSSTDETYSSAGGRIQFYGFVGQSFTPSLSAVEFVRVKLFDITPGNALGATLVMNLRSNAINGPIIGTATPLVLTNGFSGSANFLFPTAISVVPNLTYFFETSVLSGDDWGFRTMSNVPGDNYPNGFMFGGLTPAVAGDLWFREGIIVVPEPTSVSLLILASALAAWRVRRTRS